MLVPCLFLAVPQAPPVFEFRLIAIRKMSQLPDEHFAEQIVALDIVVPLGVRVMAVAQVVRHSGRKILTVEKGKYPIVRITLTK